MPELPWTKGAPRKILLATDLSCRCDRALDRAAELARSWKADVVVVHALKQAEVLIGDEARPLPSWRRPEDRAQIVARQLKHDMTGSNIELSIVVEEDDPADLILRVATARHCDLIVTGIARDETFGRLILGTTVDGLIRRSRVPILIVKDRVRGSYRNVLIATDFSASSRHALDAGVRYFPDRALTIFHAFEIPFGGVSDDDHRVEEVRRVVAEECAKFLRDADLSPEVRRRLQVLIEYGSPAGLLRDYAHEKDVDLVILGTHGRGRMLTAVIGSTAKAILDSLACDALVVREPLTLAQPPLPAA
ncbi:MAG: universal stress protein [Dongiaceae bacterium]